MSTNLHASLGQFRLDRAHDRYANDKEDLWFNASDMLHMCSVVRTMKEPRTNLYTGNHYL